MDIEQQEEERIALSVEIAMVECGMQEYHMEVPIMGLRLSLIGMLIHTFNFVG